jgi:nitroimidazol reductase NimA-like FMN-containing flavoprotein (pyridoxamine 5'-phosphate oxidase superfamily)
LHETNGELRRLQRLLDESYASSGAHLRSIFTDERRIRAEDLVSLLPGVQVLALATVTGSGEPRVAPVDGLFFRGQFYFGSSPESVRFRHLEQRPQVSAAHVRGEELAVIVHGVAQKIDTGSPAHRGFRDYAIEVYGPGWEQWGAGAAYARIDAAKMFTFRAG